MAYFCDSRDKKKLNILVTVFERTVKTSQLLSILFLVFSVKCVEDRLIVLIYEDNDFFAGLFCGSRNYFI